MYNHSLLGLLDEATVGENAKHNIENNIKKQEQLLQEEVEITYSKIFNRETSFSELSEEIPKSSNRYVAEFIGNEHLP